MNLWAIVPTASCMWFWPSQMVTHSETHCSLLAFFDIFTLSLFASPSLSDLFETDSKNMSFYS